MMQQKKTLIAIATVIVLAVAWYALSPLLRNVELDEASPLNNQPSLSMTADPSPSAIVETKILAQGNFIANAHDVKGKALLINDNGKKILRFEDFETINGPDVRIYLSKNLDNADYVEVDKLKATKGNVNYNVADSVDINKYNKVLVWCEDFSILFSYAELK